MVAEGDTAPDFTVPKAGGAAYDDVEPFTLSDHLGDGPVVLAFFPAAFTGGCTEEMCTFRDGIGGFEELGAKVYGVSVDLPFALNVFIRRHDLNFPMLSDSDRRLVHDYDVVLEGIYGVPEVAERSVFVVDGAGTVTYRWVREPGVNPDFDDLLEWVREAVERAR